MVRLFGDSTDRNVCERIAKDCCVLPDAVRDLRPVMDMADRAVAPGDKDDPSLLAWRALAKGMADYRARRFDSAARWLHKAIVQGEPSRDTTAYFYLAMAEFKAGRGPDAEADFIKGTELREKYGPHKNRFGGYYQDWIIAVHARNEAAKLLGHPIESPATPSE